MSVLPVEALDELPLEQQLLVLEEEELRRARRRTISRLFPEAGPLRRELYPKHVYFFGLGKTHRQRSFMAANRVGKSLAGLYELTMHMTGEYPEWWPGRRFRHPVKAWLAGDTSKTVRTSLQPKLLGDWGDFGTGVMPGDRLLHWTTKSGVPQAVDTIAVRRYDGAVSTCEFKSYEEGRESFQATERHVILLDEEPPEDIYSECVTRTMTTSGLIMLTFTPLRGVSQVVSRFLTKGVPVEGPVNESRALVMAGWRDVPHLTAEDRAELAKEYPNDAERKARTEGIPTLGSGQVFQIAEDDLVVDPFQIPEHWPQGGGLDFGIAHPMAAVHMAWDRDGDVVYLVKDWRSSNMTPLLAKQALDSWPDLPWAWPQDGLQRDKGSGVQVKAQFEAAGFRMMTEHAQFPDGTTGVEAGILEMRDRMLTGRFKVFRTCGNWLAEYRVYHRKDGLIVKIDDDTISASRYAYMMRRYWGNLRQRKSGVVIKPNWRTS